MSALGLHGFHQALGAHFAEVNGQEVVADYGEVLVEHAALRSSVGLLDLGFRGRLCLTGSDRVRLLNGQVTNDVKNLSVGQGCYAALVTAKGKMESDLNIYCLPEELLLDFEPGLTAKISARLEKYIIADDVQVVDVAPHFGLLSVQGPRAGATLSALEPALPLPGRVMDFTQMRHETYGQLYCMHLPRGRTIGFDLYLPVASLPAAAEKLLASAESLGGRACGWQALEIVRIEAGLPRFGVDMDETNLAPEAGIAKEAISYTKGCYIGQEIIARLRSYGQVAKALRGLRLQDSLKMLPKKGDKLIQGDREIGYVTSAVTSPTLKTNIALGYVRRECNAPGTRLTLRTAEGDSPAEIVEVPFTA